MLRSSVLLDERRHCCKEGGERMRLFGRQHAARASLLLLIAATPTQGFGQMTYDGCRDVRGIPVVSTPGPINDVAVARLGPRGEPVIIYNPNVLRWMAPQTRLFWYAHECAHHALGHAFGAAHPLEVEQQADCWGIRTLMERGTLSQRDLPIIQRDISRSTGDWTHLPGPRRALNLSACLESSRRSRGRKDSCEFARDGECDEPDVCDPGTDTADCADGRKTSRRRGPNSCEFARDGECDEPDPCAPGTDTRDCRAARGGSGRSTRRVPMPPPATVCMTNFGPCPMAMAVPIGSPCLCPGPYGAVPGIAN